jgi:hypothetical protein
MLITGGEEVSSVRASRRGEAGLRVAGLGPKSPHYPAELETENVTRGEAMR